MSVFDNESDVIKNGVKAFSGHSVNFRKLQAGIEVLDFRKPGTCWYYVRVVFDNERGAVYISGDLGEAVVCPTCPATLTGVASCFTSRAGGIRVNAGYFIEKVRCSSDLYEWSVELFRKDFTQNCRERCIVLPDDFLDEHLDSYFADIEVDDRNGVRISGDAKAELEDQDHDYWEWLYDCGKRVSPRVILWLVAIRLAYEAVTRGSEVVSK